MKINGREVEAEKGEPILGPIRAQGIKVPTLCHLEGLEPYGACRLCIVEVGSGERAKLVTSCNFPADEGLEIRTDTARVHRNRAMLAELLLARSPGVKRVQEIAASLGVKRSRLKTIAPSNCLLCGLCVRVCNEIVGASAIGFEGRGVDRVVGTPFYIDPEACIACGACSEVCPTGAMQMEEKTKERWRKELGGFNRLCRYARMGAVSSKVCPKDFYCATCEVDQHFLDELGMHPALALAPGRKLQPRKVSHFYLLEDRLYSRGHGWVKIFGEQARLGLDDFAQRVLGRLSAVSLNAAPGKTVRRGEPALTVESNGHRATMLFPLSGKIIRVNPLLQEDASLLNEDCYQRGWIYTLEPEDRYRESRQLLGPRQVDHWLQEESDRLFGYLSTSGGTALADGGELLPDFTSHLDEDGWQRLVSDFFAKV